MSDEPIVPQNFLYGINVVDIGDARVSRGKSKRPYATCSHLNVSYDNDERRIYCNDCEKTVDSFDAFLMLVKCFDKARSKIEDAKSKLEDSISHNIRRVATKTLDKEWMSTKTVPICPHCKEGLLPDDFKKPPGKVSKELTERKRKNKPD